MSLHRNRSTTEAPRSIWGALGLNADPAPEVTDSRLIRLAEVAAIWPFVLFAQILAPVTVALVVHYTGHDAMLGDVATRGGLIALMSLGALLQLKLPRAREWPTQMQVRTLTLSAAGIGAGLLWLLPLLATPQLTQFHLAGFVAIFAAVTITAIAIHPVRAATLSYAATLGAMVMFRSGIALPSAVAALAFVTLIVATVRLARDDQKTTERHGASTNAGRLAEQLVREVEEHGDGWFWQTDRQGFFTYLSAKVAREFERLGTITHGAKLIDTFRVDAESGDTERTLNFHLSTRTSFTDYSVCPATDEESDHWWSISGRPVLDGLGRFQGFVGSGRDLTEKRRSDAEITRLALFDGLTGLANRQRMRASLDKTLAPQSGTGTTALFLLDLDRFKAVNDTLGHQVGDALLKQVAQRLQRAVGEAGLVGRLGGDEFKVVLPGMGNRDRLSELAIAVINAVSQPFFIEGSSISVGCSVGIAVAPEDGTDSETLTRNADIAMYAAKGDGRGIHRFFRPELLEGAKSRKLLEDDLRGALAGNQFHVAYQPVVSTEGARIVGFEALIRWDHPTRGSISPAEFIPIAEESGLIEPIGEWVLRTACREAATWPNHVRVAVNVSPIQFANPALPAIVTSALAASGLAAERLELEITEGVFLNETSSSEAMFKSLKGIGVRLALDDFGTGYSSLGYLKKAPFDKIKIDQSFVRGAAVPGNRNAAIIKAIVTLANTLYMETTAEGVEHQDEVELIRELGCSHIQGFVYGKAARCEDVILLLEGSGGIATPRGFKVSRSPRSRMLRTAQLDLGSAQGEVRIRNISSTGALIDGIEFPSESGGVDVMIELLEGQMFPATVKWAKDGKAGLEFAEYFNLERLNAVAPNRGLRKAG
ncbi:bifunctional diguanylate cyclase/phosphodiesterase [Sphingomonas bacterium]|uniref:putative bifunctional diguanylate cyclase/phosphodiesterase n=1 Tax=Sphingomonas bacterium TaxID=1895847 RepID=UPI0026030DEB|nr:bifunctional diguanylate cyclase/phosphodiesterase [Sphingomonas bacterium]MDB5677994.1 diguanylate cyclase [Sphingomonas bacterium]